MSRANPRYKRTNISLPSTTGQGVVEYIIQGQVEGQMTISTWYYLGSVSLPTLTQLNALIVSIRGSLMTPFRNVISPDWNVVLERLNVVTTAVVQGVVSTTSAGLLGTQTGVHLPNQNACLVRRQTATKGQHGRGRLFTPAVPSSTVTQSTIVLAGMLTALGLLASNMLLTASDGTNTWNPCVAQRSTVSPKLVTNAQALQSSSFSTLVATIRRRRVGRGK